MGGSVGLVPNMHYKAAEYQSESVYMQSSCQHSCLYCIVIQCSCITASIALQYGFIRAYVHRVRGYMHIYKNFMCAVTIHVHTHKETDRFVCSIQRLRPSRLSSKRISNIPMKALPIIGLKFTQAYPVQRE